MKQILLIFPILILITSCKIDQEIYLSADHKTAFELASKTEKKIIIDFYTQWCGTCKAYDKYIFPDSAFQHYIKSKFYFLRLDSELPENIEISKKYKIYAYPTIVVLDHTGNEINRITGYFGKDPQYYIDLIDNILKGKENYESYQKQFLTVPDSVELFREIIGKLFSKDDYKNIISFVDLAKEHTTNSEIILESKIYKGIAAVRDNHSMSTATLRAILENHDTLTKSFEEGILCELASFYKDTPDSFEYFGFRLLEHYPKSFYNNRNFAEYLFLNDRYIETARKYAAFYDSINNNDHWAAYLIALSYASNNDVEGGADYFDNWLKDHISNIDSDWPLFFYVQYATLYNTRIDKAIKYAYNIENGSCDKIEIRIYLAQLLYKKGERAKAIEKLTETIPMINSSEEKMKVDALINEFSIEN